MIGEDAVNSTTAMMNKLLQIILEIIRMRNEYLRYGNRNVPQNGSKTPKIEIRRNENGRIQQSAENGRKNAYRLRTHR